MLEIDKDFGRVLSAAGIDVDLPHLDGSDGLPIDVDKLDLANDLTTDDLRELCILPGKLNVLSGIFSDLVVGNIPVQSEKEL